MTELKFLPANAEEMKMTSIIETLRSLGVELPEQPAEVLKRHQALRAQTRPTTANNRDAIDSAATAYAAGDPERAERLLQAATGEKMRQQAIQKARSEVAAEFVRTVRTSSILTSLAERARPLIEQLVKTAALPHLDAARHLRDGDDQAAHLAAHAGVAAATLAQLHKIRAQIIGTSRDPLPGVGFTRPTVRDQLRLACGIWQHPDKAVDQVATATVPETAAGWCGAIRAGLDPWFPSAQESDALAAKLHDKLGGKLSGGPRKMLTPLGMINDS